MAHVDRDKNSHAPECDTIIIGGGHNGLVAASFLAKAGQKVQVYEASSHWGGAAATHEIAPGIKVNAVAQQLNAWPHDVTASLNLTQHGLQLTPNSAAHSVALAQDGQHIILRNGRAEGKNLSPTTEQAWQNFTEKMGKFARLLAPILSDAPPILSGRGDGPSKFAAAKLALRLRLLGRRDMREFLRIIGMNGFDLAHDYLSEPLLQGIIAFDACQTGYLGPRAPGTVLPYLWHLASEARAAESLRQYRPYDQMAAHSLGGVAAVPSALAKAAGSYGAGLSLDTPVRNIIIENGCAVGVELENGKKIRAKRVVATISPKKLMLDLVGAAHLDGGFAHQMNGLKSRGRTAILHLVLDQLPQFKGLDADSLGGRLVIAPSSAAVERAFDATKYGNYAEAPPMAITIPTLSDPALAKDGKHILSAMVLGAPDANDSRDTAKATEHRVGLMAACLRQIEFYAPGINAHIKHQHLALPIDIEQNYGVPGGAWHGIDLGFDRFYALRPSFELADYSTPITGLYATGAAFHPGGGITGWPGYNVARRLLRMK
ncbi:MAG: NAD(P)/FAD-dependent oxidoreductase [Alphaproteobacteria bacterium]|nr:NAD(P)/FAD-dependent oxidoreductase [Alphaproteobacteria bacterium]